MSNLQFRFTMEDATSKLIFSVIFAICTLSLDIVNSQEYEGEPCTIRTTGEPGVCKSFNSCPSAQQLFQSFDIRPTLCGFAGSDQIICCVEQKPTTEAPERRPQNEQSQKRISERKCEEYSTEVTIKLQAIALLPITEPVSFNVEKCDFGSTQLIVGGQNAKLGEYPHMAAIGWDAPGGGYKFKCGGSLISEDYVLTAAHCTFIDATDIVGYEPIAVRLGEHNINSDSDGANPVDVRISSIIIHPGFKYPSKYNDIALLRLQSPVQLTKFIRPACLWTNPIINDTRAIATGWGNTEDLGSPSDILQSVGLNIIDKSTCSRLFRVSTKLGKGIIDDQLCAGDLDGGKDACQGDSGGPLQISSQSNRCIYYVIGITSFGAGCGAENTAGVYTRTSSYVDWIESQVWGNQK